MRVLRVLPLLLATEIAGAEPAVQPALRSQPLAAESATEAGDDLSTGQAVLVKVPGDKPVRVLHAPRSQPRALIYLHGWCGRPESAEDWKHAALAHGSVIALTAELHCANGRTRWGKRSVDTDQQHERIQRALRAVKEARGGALDLENPIIIGYSQGAARAYRLARRYPKHYQRLVLGGPPEKPSMYFLSSVRAMAVLGGELETTERMREGTADLQEAGKLARYFIIPKARHGEFGPEAERMMHDVLSWLVRVAPE